MTPALPLLAASAFVSPLAHVGHWAVNLLYVAPVLLVLAVLVGAHLHPRATDGGKDTD